MEYGHHIYAMDEMKKYYFDVLNSGKELGISMSTLRLIDEDFAKN